MKSATQNALTRLVLSVIAFGLLTGCGGASNQPTCTPTGFAMAVGPADPTATPDHTAKPPGNQQLFQAGLGDQTGPALCVFHPLYKLTPAQWTTSDPLDVSISSAGDATNGVATCLAATKPGATVSATLTAYGFTETVSTPISCK